MPAPPPVATEPDHALSGAPDPVAAAVLRLTEARGDSGSICPSEVARALASDWRPLLGPVRRAAARLAADGRIDILRKGKPIDPAAIKGVIRLRRRGN